MEAIQKPFESQITEVARSVYYKRVPKARESRKAIKALVGFLM